MSLAEIIKRTNTGECSFNVGKSKHCIRSPSIISALSKSFGGHDPIETAKKKLNCKSEICVIQSPIISRSVSQKEIEEEVKANFKPIGPTKPPILLNNFDINSILLQLEKAYDGFIGVPFQMIDFQTFDLCSNEALYPEEKRKECNLAKIDFPKKIKEGYKWFGTVVNTDDHSKGGTHWFCLFGDFTSTPYTLEYFNSSGRPPLIEISVWLKDNAERISSALGVPVLEKSDIRIEHQRDEHSCGIYALGYIYGRLNGLTHEYFGNYGAVSDALMTQMRKFFFIEP